MNIHPSDAAAIERYLVAVGHMEHSPLGAMLDRLELYSERAPVIRQARPRGHVAHCMCPDCDDGLTARPTLGQEPHAKDGPDDAVLSRPWAGAVLAEVGRASKRSEHALRAWFGDHGASWSNHREGRLGALFALTTSGEELVRRWRARSRGQARDMDAHEIIQSTVASLSLPDGKLIDQARIEAVKLRSEAESAWNHARRATRKSRA